MKKFLKNFIKKIAEQNDKTFGNGKLDCCDINKSNNNKMVDNKSK